MQKRLLLVNPPFPRKVAGVPLNLLYLASAFEGTEVDRQIIDLNIVDDSQWEEKLVESIEFYRPTHVGVTSYSPNRREALKIMSIVKDTDGRVVTISGGPHETAIQGLYDRPDFVDFAVTDTYGENALLEILGCEKRIPENERSGLFPSYELLGSDPSYQFDPGLFEGRNMTQILTSTGCDQGCTFCASQIGYQPINIRAVLHQIETLRDLGYESVFFNDPNFTSPSKGTEEDREEFDTEKFRNLMSTARANKVSANYLRVLGLTKAMKDAGVGEYMTWGCQTKASMVNEFMLDMMAKAGCRYITYALETIDEKRLGEMKKGIKISNIDDAIKWSRERGIKTGMYVMFGGEPRKGERFDPEEDFAIARATLNYVEKIRPDYLSISVLAYYPMFDRENPKQRLHTELARRYEEGRFSREPVWLEFDEGWGAYHPHAKTSQALRYKKELDSKRQENPRTWDPRIPGAIRRF